MQRHDIFIFESIKGLVAMQNPRGPLNPNAYNSILTSILTPREIMASKWVALKVGKTEWAEIQFVIARKLSSSELVFFYTSGKFPPHATTRLLPDALPLIHDIRLYQSIPPSNDSIPQGWIDTMFHTMYVHNAMGLAANQIGYSKRIFVMDEVNTPRIFINPVIEYSEGEIVAEEGCVSYLGKFIRIKRAERVIVNGIQLDGVWARVAQHEIDHLNGITLLDYE